MCLSVGKNWTSGKCDGILTLSCPNRLHKYKYLTCFVLSRRKPWLPHRTYFVLSGMKPWFPHRTPTNEGTNFIYISATSKGRRGFLTACRDKPSLGHPKLDHKLSDPQRGMLRLTKMENHVILKHRRVISCSKFPKAKRHPFLLKCIDGIINLKVSHMGLEPKATSKPDPISRFAMS